MDCEPNDLKNKFDIAVQSFNTDFTNVTKEIQQRLKVVEEKEKKVA